jgi:hypothetical protein
VRGPLDPKWRVLCDSARRRIHQCSRSADLSEKPSRELSRRRTIGREHFHWVPSMISGLSLGWSSWKVVSRVGGVAVAVDALGELVAALASTAILGTWSLLVYYRLLGNGGEDGII